MGLLDKIKNTVTRNKVNNDICKEIDAINTIEDLSKFVGSFCTPVENMFFEVPIVQNAAADKEESYVKERRDYIYNYYREHEVLDKFRDEKRHIDWNAVKAYCTDDNGVFDEITYKKLYKEDSKISLEHTNRVTGHLEASFHDYWVCRAKAMYDSAKEAYTADGLTKYDNYFRNRLLKHDNREDALVITGVTLGLYAPTYHYLSGYSNMLNHIDEKKYYSKRHEKDYRHEKRMYDLMGEQFLKDNSYFARMEVLLTEIINSEFTEDEKRRIYDYARYVTDVIIKNKMVSFVLAEDDNFSNNGKINALIYTEAHKNYVINKCIEYIDRVIGININNWSSSSVAEQDGLIKGTCVTVYELWGGFARITSNLLEQVRLYGKFFTEMDDAWFNSSAKKNYSQLLANIPDFEVKEGNFNNAETYFIPAYQLLGVAFEQYLVKFGGQIIDEGAHGLAEAWFAHYGYESMYVDKSALSFKKNADARACLDKQNMWS